MQGRSDAAQNELGVEHRGQAPDLQAYRLQEQDLAQEPGAL